MTLTFNNNIPGVIFKVQQTGTMVQIKPFASYYIWLDWFDLAPLDQTALIDALQIDVDASAAAASAAQTDANTAIANAASAQATADQAILDAAAALAAANDADAAIPLPRRATMFHDESTVSGGTATTTMNATQRYGYVRFCVTQLHQFRNSFVANLAPGATITFLGATNNGSGIMEVYLDEDHLTSVDFYSATLLPNVEKTVSIPSATYDNGYHKLWMVVVNKHVSSSGYAILLTKIHVQSNTGD